MPIDLVQLAALEHERETRPINGPVSAVDATSALASILVRGEPHAWQRPATVGAQLDDGVLRNLFDLLTRPSAGVWSTLCEWRAWFQNRIKTFTPSETIKAEQLIRAHLRQEIERTGAREEDPGVALGIRVRFHLKDRAARKDIDNCLKTVCEATTGTLVKDDKQIVQVFAEKLLGSDDPRTEALFYSCGVFR